LNGCDYCAFFYFNISTILLTGRTIQRSHLELSTGWMKGTPGINKIINYGALEVTGLD
jgi:hypothetical protein